MTGTLPAGGSRATDSMVWIRGGEFAMGSEDFYPDEGQIRRVSVAGFWIDRNQVTNAQQGRADPTSEPSESTTTRRPISGNMGG